MKNKFSLRQILHHRMGFHASVLLALAAPTVIARSEEHRVEIHHAIEVEFETERGHLHHVQGSDDLQHWTNIDDGIAGRGKAMSTLLSIQSTTNKPFNFFRVVTEEIPTNGPSPLSLQGFALQMDDTTGHDSLKFLSETNGVKTGTPDDAFNYLFTRVSTNEVQIEITRPGEPITVRRDLLSLTFSTPTTGNWVRDSFRKNRLKNRSLGVFQLLSTSTDPTLPPTGTTSSNTPPVLPTEIPASAAGLVFTFGNGSEQERVDLATTTSGMVLGDDIAPDDSHNVSYLYTLTDTNQATLVVTFKPGKRDEYALTFKNPSQGSFVRKEIKNDLLDDTDTGSFSVAFNNSKPATGSETGNNGEDHGGNSGGGHSGGNDDDSVSPGTEDHPKVDDNPASGSGTGGNPISTSQPLASLSGTQLSFDDDIPADVYSFANETSGVKTHGADTDPFAYDYTVSGAIGKFKATFKPGRWTEMDLTFSSPDGGSFVRRDFDKGSLKATKSGHFKKL